MPFTNFPNGLTSFGVPLPSGSLYPANGKPHLWVNGNLGSDGVEGTSPDAPLLTMARAFQLVGSGYVIHVLGNIREQISTPAGIFDVTVIGEGTIPRHADAHTGNNGFVTATWKPPAVPTLLTPLVNVLQQGWRFANILFAPPTDAAAIAYTRNAAAGDLERDSSHSGVYGCRFAGGSIGIQVLGTENVFDVHVVGNIFNDATGYAIRSVNPYSWRWVVENNIFMANVNNVVAGHTQSVFRNNVFGKWTTLSLVLTGGGGDNVITGNYLTGAYAAPQYTKAAASDEWAGNYNVAGQTTVVPA
jgi:hypothetical protein